MNEIELKFAVDNLEEVKQRLLDLGCEFFDVLNQKDTIYLPDINDTKSEEGKIFVRIRNENGLSILNLKKQSSVMFSSKEIEFEISDEKAGFEFLETLGLKRWVVVDKKRLFTSYKKFNICIDEVDRLGSFIEIEIISNENNTDICEEKILEFAHSLNIDTSKRVNKHYDTMIAELNK